MVFSSLIRHIGRRVSPLTSFGHTRDMMEEEEKEDEEEEDEKEEDESFLPPPTKDARIGES